MWSRESPLWPRCGDLLYGDLLYGVRATVVELAISCMLDGLSPLMPLCPRVCQIIWPKQQSFLSFILELLGMSSERHISMISGIWAGAIFIDVECVGSKSKVSIRFCGSLYVKRARKYSNFSFTSWDILACP